MWRFPELCAPHRLTPITPFVTGGNTGLWWVFAVWAEYMAVCNVRHVTLQTYMTHLADYYDPDAMGEGADSGEIQPFLRELSHNQIPLRRAGNSLEPMDVELAEPKDGPIWSTCVQCGGQVSTTLCARPNHLCLSTRFVKELRDMAWYNKVFTVVNFPANLVSMMSGYPAPRPVTPHVPTSWLASL